MWAVHRQSRLVRYTLPLHEITKCSKLVLKVTDVDQKLLQVHAHKIAVQRYLVCELRAKDVFVCLMQNEEQQYVLRKLPAQPGLWMLRPVGAQQLVMVTEQAALVEVFQDKPVQLVDPNQGKTQRKVLGMQSENTIVC